MTNHNLQPLTEQEKKFAEANHNLIYSFLRRYRYSIEEYYHIAVLGYLKAVQIYHRRKDLQKKYDFPYISYYYMRSELGNHFRMQNSQKRKPLDELISLDADYTELENLYNTIGGKSAEADLLERLLLNDIMERLSVVQQNITRLKIDGYSSKEAYLLLEIPSSTYYKEMQRIKAIVENLLFSDR